MKKIIPVILTLIGGSALAQYPSQNISLLSHWDTAKTIAEPIYNIRYSSVWGWVDPQDNREYAIIGATDGTYFIDVTAPTSPIVRDFVAGRRDSCIWREFKTYQNYLYAVSDDGVNTWNQNSLQIINMSYLPDSVHVEYDNNTLVERSHTIMIDGNKMYLNSVTGPATGGHSRMAVFSLANPTNPTLVRKIEQDYPSSDNVHDSYVRNDTCYASSSYGGLFIYKFTSSNQFQLIGSLTSYPEQGYNHSSALTANGKTLIFADEVPADLKLKSLDVSNMSNLTVLKTFEPAAGDTATPHNPFIRQGDNNYVIVAYYQSGVQIFDISNPANPVRSGFFDTAPLNCPTCNNENYSGCWGVYVDLPSGNILASDMQAGLFVLNASGAMSVPTSDPVQTSLQVYPNPFHDQFTLSTYLPKAENVNWELTDLTGKVIRSGETSASAGKFTLTIPAKELASGTYLVRLHGESVQATQKIIQQH